MSSSRIPSSLPSRRALALALGLLAAVTLLPGCDQAQGESAHGPAAMPPPEVTAVSVAPQSVSVSREYVGQTEGSRDIEVRARVTGILLERVYREGSTVAPGAPLFRIDPAPFEVAVAQARAELASAVAREAQARREAARLKPLIAQRAISQREYDDSMSALDVARANLELARARLRAAELDLGYTRVTAPIGGTTGRAMKSEGSLVTANADSLLTRVTQVDPIRVNFSLSENERLNVTRETAAGRLQLPADGGLDVEILLGDGTTYGHRGRVDFSVARFDPATGTLDLRAEFPNPDHQILPGQFVRVRVNGGTRPNAILVPQRSVLDGPQGKFVYVVEDGKAQVRPVEVGDWHGKQWVVSEGLDAGDSVIVDGVVKVRPGAPVRMAQAVPDAPAKPGSSTAILSDASGSVGPDVRRQ